MEESENCKDIGKDWDGNKPWEKLNDSLKIERIRNVVKILQRENQILQEKVHLLENHSHDKNNMTIPYKSNRINYPRVSKNIDYF